MIAALLIGLALLVGAVLWIVDGAEGALLTVGLLLALGLGALATAEAAAGRRRALGPLRRQFALAVGVAVGQMLVAVAVFVAVMFVGTHDAVLIALVSAFTGAVAVLVARRIAAGVLSDVETIRDGLAAVGQGRRDVRVDTGGCDELHELAEEANAMIERLAVEERMRRELVAAVSHDLRTPITSLKLLASAIEDEIVDAADRARYLQQMRLHIEALGGLIDDLFELSRLEAGDIAWSVQRVALGSLLSETVDSMRVHAAAKNVAVSALVPDDLAPARANPEKLQRVLFNLIQNAIRHTPADGSVTVRASAGAGVIEVEVADTGDGIPEDDRQRVFEAFTRGDGARSGGRAGLGLAISRAIVEAHGGRIWLADSALGTRVRFSVPQA